MTKSDDQRLYKILSANDWAVAQSLGYTRTALDQGDGYVHLSTRAQVAETLALHYAGQAGVQLLEYATSAFTHGLSWEESRGGQLFPHLYGRLHINAAKRVWSLQPDADGNPILPSDIDR